MSFLFSFQKNDTGIVVLGEASQDGVARALFATAFILSLFLCVVLHEFGHALTARRFGAATRDITLYPIGGIASLEKMPSNPIHEFLIALAGPFVNVVIAAILLAILGYSDQIPSFATDPESYDLFSTPFLWSLFVANAVLALFNMVPAFPMDGGRALRALLSIWTDRYRATRIAASMGQSLAIFFVFIGFFYNFWLVFIGLFVFIGAGFEFANERARHQLSGLTVRDALMHKFIVLRPDDYLAKAAEELLDSQDTEFVVADENHTLGLLTKADIIRGLTDTGPNAYVSAYMNSDFIVVKTDMKLEDFLQEVLIKGQDVALVQDGDETAGLIDRANVEEKLLIRNAMLKGKD